MRRSLALTAALVALAGCSSSHPGGDAGGARDGASRADAGSGTPTDGGAPPDGGTGPDSGAGRDGGTGSDSGMVPPDWQRCTGPMDCVLVANSCCGACGAPTLSDVDAVNQSMRAAHTEEVCPVPEPCPGCPSAPNPYLVATCEVGLCRAVDVRQSDVSACNTSSDCVVRTRDCCPCGADTGLANLIAIRTDAEVTYAQLVCDPRGECAECEPSYPTDVTAQCSTDGHCEIVSL